LACGAFIIATEHKIDQLAREVEALQVGARPTTRRDTFHLVSKINKLMEVLTDESETLEEEMLEFNLDSKVKKSQVCRATVPVLGSTHPILCPDT
jgi:hypothetical protein